MTYREQIFPYPKSRPDYALGKWLKAALTGGASLVVDNAGEKKAAQAQAQAAQAAAAEAARQAAALRDANSRSQSQMQQQQNIIRQYETINAPAAVPPEGENKNSMVPVLIAVAVIAGLVFILKKKK